MSIVLVRDASHRAKNEEYDNHLKKKGAKCCLKKRGRDVPSRSSLKTLFG